jgi:hypothetical protein
MRHTDFSRIAEEEAQFASQADGISYFVRTAPADGGLRTEITIHVLHPKSGESLPIFATPKERVDMPVLIGLTDEGARNLVQESLSIARANRKAELYLDDFLGASDQL